MKSPAVVRGTAMDLCGRFRPPSLKPNYRGSNGASVGGVQGQSPWPYFLQRPVPLAGACAMCLVQNRHYDDLKHRVLLILRVEILLPAAAMLVLCLMVYICMS